MTITKITGPGNWNNTSYGNIWINSSIPQIAEWKFQINKKYGGCSICLCLVSCDNRLNEDCNDRKNMIDIPNYAFSNANGAFIRDPAAFKTLFTIGIDKPFTFGKDDVISMVLDSESRRLFLRNIAGETSRVIKNIKIGSEIKYKMAVTFNYISNCISLIDFKSDLI